jgi:AcrR family transcriptional regulator
MTRRVDKITAPLRAADPGDDPRETLEAFARSMLELATVNKGYSVLRVVIQSASEMPDVAREVYEAGPRQARRQLAAFLRQENERGRLKVDDAEQAAEFFAGMVMGHNQLRVLLNLPSEKTAAEHYAAAAEAAARFLRAYAP